MKIHCQNKEQFYEAILALVKRGLTFDAYRDTFTITLSGGY